MSKIICNNGYHFTKTHPHFKPTILHHTTSPPKFKMATKFTTLFRLDYSSPFLKPPRRNPLFSVCYSTLHYGPSLHKRHPPSPPTPLEKLNEADFTRVFDIPALRVPASLCFALETRLRGHLLNWPRVRNIARLPGDEIDPQLKPILPNSEDDELVSLNRRISGKAEGDGEPVNAVLYRDELARSFDATGFVKFRNLAKISRPAKRKKKSNDDKNSGGDRKEGRGSGRNGMALIEVVESDDREDWSGLLGEDFGPGKWRGSTRLLLLDEQYTDKEIDELPEAIKMVLKEHDGHDSAFELVRCKLTLFYDYWQLNEILEAILPKGTIIPSGFETIGHIAHLNLSYEHLPYKKIIAKVVLDKNKPKIQTVVNKVDAIDNDYRTMQLEVLAGNNSLVTTVIENGLRFHFDLATVYWNSKLSSERQRLLSFFTHSDVVCDVFAGVGPLAIPAAKKVKHVYANDLNPTAVEYLERNSVLNRLERRIEVYNMDGRRFIKSIFAHQRTRPITQVVMNLPKDAAEFLDAFIGIFSGKDVYDKQETLPRIHVYGFSKAQDPEFDFHERIRVVLSEVAVDVQMHKVRLVAPGKWMLCASFILPETIAYSKTGSSF